MLLHKERLLMEINYIKNVFRKVYEYDWNKDQVVVLYYLLEEHYSHKRDEKENGVRLECLSTQYEKYPSTMFANSFVQLLKDEGTQDECFYITKEAKDKILKAEDLSEIDPSELTLAE